MTVKETLTRYHAELVNSERLYMANWVLAYGSAYNLAFEKFQETLKAQKEYEKFLTELAMMALTMGIGGGLSALFGKAALSSVVLEKAVDTVCNRNMNRTFNAMAFVASSPAGSYIAKKSWENASKLLTDKTQTLVNGLITQNPIGLETIHNPDVLQNDLSAYTKRTLAAAHATAQNVADATIIPDELRIQILKDLLTANLITKTPTTPVPADREQASKDMELALYMVLVMNSDIIAKRMITEDWSERPSLYSEIDTKKRSINVPTTSPNYPKTQKPHVSRGMGGRLTSQTVVIYDRLGTKIMQRIEELYKERFNDSFEKSGYGMDEIARAERVSSRIQGLYSRTL